MLFFGFRFGNRPAGALCCVAVAFLALGLTAQAPAQDPNQTLAQPSPADASPSQPSQAPTLSIAAREVLLDIVVTDREGHPVTGLTAADFAVTEEGDPQRLTHLEEHQPMSAAELALLKSAPALPPNTFTNFAPVMNTNSSTVILLDALNSGLETQMELRAQFIDYLQHMQPGTPVAIFQIDTGMRLIQGFSSDPQILLDAAKGKRNMPSLLKPLSGPGTEYRLDRLGILREGFQMMGRYLAGFPGRKNLVWFTGAVPQTYLSDPLGSSFGKSFKDDFAVLEGFGGDPIDALTLSRVAVYPIDARGLQTPPQFMASNNGGFSSGANQAFERNQAFQHMDLDAIAESTGGKAYYNTNAVRKVLTQIVDNGSNYYTVAYSTTNKTWNGQFRHIKVTIDRPGLKVQHRPGYYAVDRAKAEQRLLAAMQRRKARTSKDPFGDEDSAGGDESDASPPASSAPGSTGALIKHPKGGFEASMQLGAAPPTEVILTASLAENTKVVKLDKKAPLPTDNYLEADYKGKPFRTYTVQIKADASALRLTQSADGMRHGRVDFATLVYDQSGTRINSLLTTAVLNINEAHYRRLLASGLTAQQQIAVPVKGNYFLRVGVRDIASDHIGALEIPVDEVRAGVFGQGLARQ